MGMSNIKALPTFAAKANEETVQRLEGLLEMAKAGKINSIAYACTLVTDEAYTGFTSTPNVHLQISSLAILQHRIITERQQFDD